MKKRIYVASSWRNDQQFDVVSALRVAGHEVYDFKNPAPGNNGFAWSAIDPDWKNWTPSDVVRMLTESTVAYEGFKLDFDAMKWANEFCLVLPCGRSAHLEAGWALGAKKPTSILLTPMEPELMYKLAGNYSGAFCLSIADVVQFHSEYHDPKHLEP